MYPGTAEARTDVAPLVLTESRSITLAKAVLTLCAALAAKIATRPEVPREQSPDGRNIPLLLSPSSPTSQAQDIPVSPLAHNLPPPHNPGNQSSCRSVTESEYPYIEIDPYPPHGTEEAQHTPTEAPEGAAQAAGLATQTTGEPPGLNRPHSRPALPARLPHPAPTTTHGPHRAAATAPAAAATSDTRAATLEHQQEQPLTQVQRLRLTIRSLNLHIRQQQLNARRRGSDRDGLLDITPALSATIEEAIRGLPEQVHRHITDLAKQNAYLRQQVKITTQEKHKNRQKTITYLSLENERLVQEVAQLKRSKRMFLNAAFAGYKTQNDLLRQEVARLNGRLQQVCRHLNQSPAPPSLASHHPAGARYGDGLRGGPAHRAAWRASIRDRTLYPQDALPTVPPAAAAAAAPAHAATARPVAATRPTTPTPPRTTPPSSDLVGALSPRYQQ